MRLNWDLKYFFAAGGDICSILYWPKAASEHATIKIEIANWTTWVPPLDEVDLPIISKYKRPCKYGLDKGTDF